MSTSPEMLRVRAVRGSLVPSHLDPKTYVGLRRVRASEAQPADPWHVIPGVLRDGKHQRGATVDVAFVPEAEPVLVPSTPYYHRAIRTGGLELVVEPAPKSARTVPAREV